MSVKIPNFFKVKTATDTRTPMDLNHQVRTTTDFFRVQPILCREMVPQDKFNVFCESFARFTPMPFPTIGQIKFINRAFFVPYRMVMEGFNDFIEENPQVLWNQEQLATMVPHTTNDVLAEMLTLDENSSVVEGLMWKEISSRGSTVKVLVDALGRQLYWSSFGGGTYYSLILHDTGFAMLSSRNAPVAGLAAGSLDNTGRVTLILNASSAPLFEAMLEVSDIVALQFYDLGQYRGALYAQKTETFSTQYPVDPLLFPDSLDNSFDFLDKTEKPRRFTNAGRKRYNLLLSLGYRVDFSKNNGEYQNTHDRSLGKLLAYLRCFLDYYANPQFAGYRQLYKFFKTRPATWQTTNPFTVQDLNDITQFATGFYDKDYFTAAWQNPATPNGDNLSREYIIGDQAGPNALADLTSTVEARQQGVNFDRPTLWVRDNNAFSQYLVDSLKDLQMYMNRHQLAGFRTVDRYLAEFGVKLSDDRSGRCYYLGSNEFSAEISDVMSTSETSEAKLGDYAGKALAYSDSRKFDFETQEYGFLILISSCVPDGGYVQGIDRENLHLTPLDFHRAQFDNLGTQAIQNCELFEDYGMPSPDGNGLVTRPQDFESTGVFGFIPRYAEYKVGKDFLTGDFAVPSRRQGMDAFHLYRLFSGREDINLTNSFTQGEQEQFDRVFNNTSPDYDHIYMAHRVNIQALRPMKSISETIEWDDDLGREIEIPAGGTQMQ